MDIVILSEYMNNNHKHLDPIDVNTDLDPPEFKVGNLVIKEYFKKENDGSFSYTKETMIVTGVDNKGPNDLSVTLKPVIKLLIESSSAVAIVNHYEETLYYIDEKWRNEGDLDKDKTCDNLILIHPGDFVYKTNISKNYMFEKDGKIIHAELVDMSNFKPTWCHI